MADDERRAHTDRQALGAFEFAGDERAGSVADGLKSFDEEHSDAGNQLHDSTHLDAETEDCGDVVDNLIPSAVGEAADGDAHYNSEEQGFAHDSEFAFQSFGVYLKLVHSGNLVERFVDDPGEGGKSLAERLGNGDALHVFVE